MREIFQNVLTASLQGSIVIAVVLLLRLVLKRAPKKYTCLLWILVVLRLLVPFHIESGLSLQPELPEAAQVETSRTQPVEDHISAIPAVPDDVQLPERGDGQTAVKSDAVSDEHHMVIDWEMIARCVWITGACGLVLYSLVSYLGLKRRVREAVKLDSGMWECGGIDTAFILGYLSPRIYIPMGISDENREFILDHERMHLRRGDHWFKLTGFLALAIHWFNPLVWLAYALLCRDIEMACDERVVQSMSLEERKSYSAALLSCSSGRAHFAACPVAFGEVSVRQRIVSVLNYRKKSFWFSVIAVIAIIFVVVCFLTNPVEKSDPLTLENWGVTMTAEEASPTGVTVVYDLPENTNGNFIINFSLWTLQWESDGEWVDVPMITDEDPVLAWNGHAGMLFPNEDVQRIALDWTTVYGEVPPGQYRIRGTLLLNQGGYGYNKDFYTPFYIDGYNVSINHTKADAIQRMAELTAADIASLDNPRIDPEALVSALNRASAHPIQRTEEIHPFWYEYLYLTEADEYVRLTAGLEENIVQIFYSSGGERETCYVEHTGLYNIIRDNAYAEGKINEFALAEYEDILRAQIEHTMEQGKDIWQFEGYEFIEFNRLDTFEHDGAYYEVYAWDVAFLAEDPAQVVMAGGMGIDGDLRVRGFEQSTYFVVTTSQGMSDYRFFTWELYLGPEETERANAWSKIAEAYGLELDEGGAQEPSGLFETLGNDRTPVTLSLMPGGDVILGPWNGWGCSNDVQLARTLLNYTYELTEEPEMQTADTLIYLSAEDWEICFHEGSNYLEMLAGGETCYYRAVPKYADSEYIGTLMRMWYDEAEYQALKNSEILIPDEGQNYLDAALAYCEAYEGLHLQATSGSQYCYTYVSCRVEAANDYATQSGRRDGMIDENGYAFRVTTVFVPENERAMDWSWAGNTREYDGSDPGVPAGACEYTRCGYIQWTKDGWKGEIVGTSW